MNRTSEPPRRALGKGLSALLPQRPLYLRQPQRSEPPTPQAHPERSVLEVPVDAISPNPAQPRSSFDADKLQELANSIRASGVIQPLLVRRKGIGFELVAGERRWRAAKIAGLDTVPVLVEDVSDDRLIEVALIENIQREDLNPIEVATALQRLIREHGLSHDEVARRTGKDRSTVTNLLRLLKLPHDVQQMLAERRLSMGHARAILGLPTEDLQRRVAEKAASQGLSVRQVERLVRRMTETRDPKPPDEAPGDPNVRAAILELERVLGTRVRIVARSENRGQIEIEYYSADDLHRIYSLIVRQG
ncbi:MAG: ParB/RepB/Spo0J family partition protein [Bryobacterales bacterium]|nr:ParB/RepB/Spo0J family partition protein [Bryobacteraceae bacterium]MDW8353006.1 ParB/RepB/Spo0J family partition protein [Bryobacterales bacterium]